MFVLLIVNCFQLFLVKDYNLIILANFSMISINDLNVTHNEDCCKFFNLKLGLNKVLVSINKYYFTDMLEIYNKLFLWRIIYFFNM